jgi:hypothetical protein
MTQMTWFKRTLGIVALVTLVTPSGWADEPWGYLLEIKNRRIHELRGDSIKVGRLTQADVTLSDPRVSRRHAEIRRGSEGAVLEDVGSTNGTRRNGERVLPGREITLARGDVLIFGFEKLLYHESLAELWDDALQHSFIASLVQLRVPVLVDRTVKSLGRERVVLGISHATVDDEKKTVTMSFPGDAVRDREFRREEVAFVGDISITEGELRLSLWGLARGGSMVSRRASMSRLKHGELRVRLAADSERESRAKLETGWSSDGVRFLFPLLGAVLESLPETHTMDVALKLTRSLVDQDNSTALRDAIRASEMLHSHAPDDAEPPMLVAQAGARWVKRSVIDLRGNVPEDKLAEFTSTLASSKTWLEKAAELDADEKKLRNAEKELAEAEEILSRVQ